MRKQYLFVLIILLTVIGVYSYLSVKFIECNNIIAVSSTIMTFLGTAILGFVNVYQQDKFRQITDTKDRLNENSKKEEQRLSFLPFISSEKYLIKEFDKYIYLGNLIKINVMEGDLLSNNNEISNLDSLKRNWYI